MVGLWDVWEAISVSSNNFRLNCSIQLLEGKAEEILYSGFWICLYFGFGFFICLFAELTWGRRSWISQFFFIIYIIRKGMGIIFLKLYVYKDFWSYYYCDYYIVWATKAILYRGLEQINSSGCKMAIEHKMKTFQWRKITVRWMFFIIRKTTACERWQLSRWVDISTEESWV